MIDLSRVWPEWKAVEKIGEGSFGKVYKCEREEFGIKSICAIKVISIPQSQAELDSMTFEGITEEGARTFYNDVVNDFATEIKLMEILKGAPNVVSVEDFKIVEKENEIGWDIYIRMEYLQSFVSYTKNKKMTEAEVGKFACDILEALSVCSQNGVIHRDIKPDNIFVDKYGTFKLGDFGVAKKLEGTMSVMSKKGTYSYMAPEVFRGEKYDCRADIYSLGMIMYKLLNRNRDPFVDLNSPMVGFKERNDAIERRRRGEKIPAPVDASPAMAEFILKAIEFRAEDRYASVEDFKSSISGMQTVAIAEEATVGGYAPPVSQSDDSGDEPTVMADDEITVAADDEPTAVMADEPTVTEEKPKKKKKKKIIIIVTAILAFLLIAAGVVTALFFIGKKTDNPPVTEGDAYHYETAKDLIEAGDFSEAYSHLVQCIGYEDSTKLLANFAFGNYERQGVENGADFVERFSCGINSDGNLTSWILFNDDMSEDDKLEYVYDSSGNLIETIGYDQGNDNGRVTYEYDTNGNVVMITDVDSDGVINGSVAYEYDSYGNCTSEIKYDDTGYIVNKQSFSYLYDANGNCTQERQYDSYGSLVCRRTQTYDANGNKVLYNYYDSDNNMLYQSVCKYDSRGNLISQVSDSYNSVRWESTQKREFFYDENNKLVKETLYTKEYENTDTDYTWNYEYNEDGNVSKLTEYVNGVISETEEYGYEYTEDSVIRTFKYYDENNHMYLERTDTYSGVIHYYKNEVPENEFIMETALPFYEY